MEVSTRFRLTALASACIVFKLLFGVGAIAQELNRPPPPGTWAVSSETRAAALLKYHEFVVLGEFIGYPEDAAGDMTKSGPRQVVVPFVVSRVFKTHLSLPDTIHVQFDADMLRYPGEEISRYSKRIEFRQQHVEWRVEFNRQITELREAEQNGFITAQAFHEKETELLAIHDAAVAEAVKIPSRRVTVLHGESFHDAGGAIGPGEKYVLGLEISRENPSIFVLAIHEYSSVKNVFWGPMRDEIAGLLDRALNP